MQPELLVDNGTISVLLRGETARIASWTARWDLRRVALHAALILFGAGVYGAAVGWWRDPQQALYTAIKLPLIILLVTIGNSLINAMLAPLLGLNIPFRQSFLAILMSFAIASVILGAFSPLVGFLIWNAPPLSDAPDARSSLGPYSVIMLVNVVAIAFAGIAANLRLRSLLRELGGNPRVAGRVLLAWLAGNLFLGSQLSWIFRPFIGSPGLPIQFLRDHPLKGNFYEAVYIAILHLLND
jgi:hypothetical protein